MDGKVYFESKKGQGSTFYLELKLEEGAPIERSKIIESKHKLIPKKNAKILIVEDNQINQKVATKTLEKLGYHSEIAGNGKIALELIQKYGIDYFSLILMDLQMPVMDGLTATKEIQKRYPDAPPVIALTANAFSSDKQSCLNAGMKDYLSKPLKKDYLEKVLLQYIK
jgi:CheY-like chemotaxis protein